MSEYRVIFDDPLHPEEPTCVLIPAPEWIKMAMAGGLPPISVYWKLQEAEEKAIIENRYENFKHNYEDWIAQFEAPRIGPLTEEEAIEYLIMKDIPRRVWSNNRTNRTLFKIVKESDLPSDRTFRNAWKLSE